MIKNALPLFLTFWGKLTPRSRALLFSSLILLFSLIIFLYAIPRNAPWLQSSAEIGISFLWQQVWQKLWLTLPLGVAGIGIAGAISWLTWLMRMILSRFYKPLVNDFRTTTSVVVPAYREDPDVIVRCLETWLANDPTEVIMVVDLADTAVLERLKAYTHDPRLRVIPFKHQGKRSALGVGIRAARGEILVLADSDTAWEPGLLDAVQMPFVDPTVGGVGTRQNAVLRESGVWRIIADWLVNVRYLDYVPAESLFGGVACLSGRTAAYRLAVVKPVVEQLEYEYFMGKQCVAGDDGRLTWLVLSQGYKTVYQSNARAWSMFPNEFQAFLKQRIRWSRNSCRCYLTAIYQGWLWQQPIVTQIRALQILLTPLTQFLRWRICSFSYSSRAGYWSQQDWSGYV